MRSFRTTRTAMGVALVVLLVVGGLTPAAAERDRPCTQGDARSIFETIEVSYEILLRSGFDNPHGAALPSCQWRFFWEDGHPLFGDIVFSDDDVILGGILLGLEYPALGISRQEAVAELKGIAVDTWLAQVIDGEVGPLVQQPLMVSAVKDVVLREQELGQVAVRSYGFITSLPAGEYRSVTRIRHADPGNSFWDDDFTVAFVVLPGQH